MGSGAGKAQKPAQAADRQGGPGSASWRRRRRLLFGVLDPGPFESIPVRQQYSEIPQDGDFVFGRFAGGIAEADGLRRLCNERKYDHDEGYLRVDALELLGLGLVSTQPLTRRLHKLAQVSHILPGPRRPLLTCYELLALFSVLRAGSKEELLELLFCVFDADGDDQVSSEDLAGTVLAFLQLQEATANFDQGDLKAFKKLDLKKKRAESLRIAQSAIKEYGQEEGEEEPQPGKEITEEKPSAKNVLEEDPAAPPTPPELPMTPQGTPGESGSGTGLAEEDDDEDDDALLQVHRNASWRTHVSQASQVAQDGDAKPKAKARGGGFCRGKPPKDSEETGTDAASKASQPEAKEGEEGDRAPKPPKPAKLDDEAETSDEDDDLAQAMAKAKAKPKAKRRGLCGSAPKEDASASEAETAEKKEKEAEKKEIEAKAKAEAEAKQKAKLEAEAKAKAQAKATSKAKAKAKAGSSFCCFGGKAPEKKLSFQQWQRWLLESQMLPSGLEEAAALGAASSPVPEPHFDLPMGYPGSRASDEIGPAPLAAPAPPSKGISERTMTETSSEGGSPDHRRQMSRPLLAS
eukprot:TRINITY_DN6284_c0_g1_i2.p1 TRINITY_DN6284_c0_g1~~TRINITY_DN6284_c0_g1_i2.p1  ORF type:complete len:577 (+),score=164.70 TRINITY_DN6284_c0_g1_i2:1023-2753(+)